MKLPKLFRVVTIEFWSLRNGVGEDFGVIFDIDTKVQRRARRVRTRYGWNWQIESLYKTLEWDWCAEQDQDTLDNYSYDGDHGNIAWVN